MHYLLSRFVNTDIIH